MFRKANQALIEKAKHDIGADKFGVDGKLVDWSHALVPLASKVRPPGAQIVPDRGRYREPHSGASITLNSFLPWYECPDDLSLCGRSGFETLRFGARCPTGIRGTPPYLDLIAAASDEITAVTARSAEYMVNKRTPLTATYLGIDLGKDFEPWRELAREATDKTDQFTHLDLAGIVKLAFGLKRTFPRYRLKLLYLFWEPHDGFHLPALAEHRKQLTEVARHVANSGVEFVAQSYHELWDQWHLLDAPDWIPDLLSQLGRRFTVSLAD